MDVVKTLRYRFVRYCVNKAYAELDLTGVPAEVVNVLDDVVWQIRDLEKYITSIESVTRLLRVDLPEKLKVLKERDPALATTFVKKLVQYCLELDEVANSRLRKEFEELLRSL
ncbi:MULTISPECIES: hypothetical protein [Pyrobaculum]|uniref:Uncharacterized protein n=2 Tax=Pyrobaculum arsenaticum TaxID=121277 RepID=A4WM81_PYRAR|nr:hypothetical protein [Pyrobaculum arsenaticum]ABP51498.1 conserved hypothetical protein [Pyrobaculum arsenaticum DSM 13514]MCY0890976.1 hypothetical protein [Pyrobaculum arsenaticum]NYR16533.1 hypothetical protein [Pyrobaculum arsenaticum]